MVAGFITRVVSIAARRVLAVRRGPRDLLGSDHRIGAGAILDQDRLPPILAHALCDHAREDVRWVRRRETAR